MERYKENVGCGGRRKLLGGHEASMVERKKTEKDCKDAYQTQVVDQGVRHFQVPTLDQSVYSSTPALASTTLCEELP